MKALHRLFLCTVLAGTTAFFGTLSHASDSIEQRVENPVEVQLGFTGFLFAASNSAVTISVTDNFGQTLTSFVIHGRGETNQTNITAFSVPTKVFETCTLSISGDELFQFHVDLSKPDRPDFKAGRSKRDKRPRGYQMTVRDEEVVSVEETNPNGTGSWSTNYPVVIKPQLRAGVGATAEPIGEDVAPGDAAWADIGPSMKDDGALGAVKWQVALGRLWNGLSAGKVRIAQEGMNNLFTPAALVYDSPVTNENLLTVVYDDYSSTNITIQQIRAPQTFLNVAILTNGYELQFYPPSVVIMGTNDFGLNDDGFYDFPTNAVPFVTWRFTNPSNDFSVLKIDEIRPTISYSTLLGFTNNVRWIQYGSGNDTRTELRQVGWLNGSTNSRAETNIVMGVGEAAVSKIVETYTRFDWGWELASVVTDPDGAALTKSFAYHTNGAAKGKLQWMIEPNGHWEKRLYTNGIHVATLTPWEDAPENPTDATISNSKVMLLGYWSTTLSPYYELSIQQFTAEFSGPYATEKGASTDSLPKQYYASATELPYFSFFNFKTYQRRTMRSGLVDYEGNLSGGLNVFWGYFNGQGLFNATSGDWLNGNKYLEFNSRCLRTVYAYHRGNYTNGSEFTLSTNGYDWRVTQFINYLSVGNVDSGAGLYYQTETVTFEGEPIDSLVITPYQTTNCESMYNKGLIVNQNFNVYTSQTNKSLLFRHVLTRDAVGHLLERRLLDGVTGAERVLYSATWTNNLKTEDIDEFGIVTRYSYDSLKRQTNTVTVGVTGAEGIDAQPDEVTNSGLNADGALLKKVVTTGTISLTNIFAYDLSRRITQIESPTNLLQWAYASNGLSVTVAEDSGRIWTTNNYLDGSVKSIVGTTIPDQYFGTICKSNFSIVHPYVEGHCFYGMGFGCDAADLSVLLKRTWLLETNGARYKDKVQDASGRLWGELLPDFAGELPVHVTYLWDTSGDNDRMFATNILGNGIRYDYFIGNMRGNVYVSEHSAHAPLSTGPTLTPRFYPDDAVNIGTRNAYFRTSFILQEGNAYFRFTTNESLSPIGAERYTLLNNSEGVDETNYVTISITKERLSGFTNGVISETYTTNYSGSTETKTVTLDRANKRQADTCTSSTTTNCAVRVTINGRVVSDGSLTLPTPTTFKYDDLGRPTEVHSPQGITLYTTYEPQSGLKLTETDFSGGTNSIEYFPRNHTNAYLLKCVTDPRGKKIYFAYNERGDKTHTWGDIPFPEKRAYSAYGEMTELHTFRGGTNWQTSAWPTSNTGTADVTKWNYQESTGLLLDKEDAKNRKTIFTYDFANRVLTKTWQRTNGTSSVTSTNTYNRYGDVIGIAYSDGTPSVTLSNWIVLAQPTTTIDGDGTNTLAFDVIGRVTSHALNGVSNSYTYSQFGRASLSVSVGTNTVTQTNAYDSATGRLLTMGANGVSATYSYLTNADLVSSITFKNGSTNVLTTSKTFEYSSRLKSITNALAGGSNISSHVYLYDAIHRRTNATLADGSYWRYGYDDRSQLTSAKHYWSGGGVVAGQQYEYSYDSIGNRTVTQSGGSQFGTSLRQTTWTVNELNQTITNSAYGYVNIFGEADASATVTANHESVYRNGEFYRKELLFSNSSGPVYPSITNVAVINNYGTNGEDIVDQVIGNVWVPKNPEVLTYDEDGNLIQDSRWVYRWDAENRLKEMETLSGLATNVPVQKLVFTYDHQGRRASKAVYAWSQSITNYQLSILTRFVYDGWNLLAELDMPQGTNAPVLTKSFLWGLDLSGTLGQAGGVGGLLAISEHSTNGLATHLPCFDGNGNVMALLKADSSTLSAKYEYAPFGEPLRVTGDAALLNPFRFSTKYTDDETGLLYYGYRYYSPAQGKWISRDPLGEEGGNNLYAFVQNDPINAIDPNGENLWKDIKTIVVSILIMVGGGGEDQKVIPKTPLSEAFKNLIERIMKMPPKTTPGAGTGPTPKREDIYRINRTTRQMRAFQKIGLAGKVVGSLGAAALLIEGMTAYATAMHIGDQGMADFAGIDILLASQALTGSNIAGYAIWAGLPE